MDFTEYTNKLKNQVIHSSTGNPPNGAQSDLSNNRISPINIVLNSQLDFAASTLPLDLKTVPGLSALKNLNLPKNFNWHDDGGEKSKYLSGSGNQMLCGSCWAIASAGIVGDNHVIAGTVNYTPDLSTTWSLACYQQAQCKGGNPAMLLNKISEIGIASNSCVDYSWCALNDECNGKATKHFKESKEMNLSSLIPKCGCIDASNDHLLYKIERPLNLSIKNDDDTDHFRLVVKTHIKTYGPVLGGFLVFKNFKHGKFTNVNNNQEGIYLENGIYTDNKTTFTDNYTTAENYMGSHAISIIGWGESKKEIVIDNKGTKKIVPYWVCKNSWTNTWGDNGKFKMAMYPFNKISQFDKVTVFTMKTGQKAKIGGMVLVKAKEKPQSIKLPQIPNITDSTTLLHPSTFYGKENKNTKGDPHNAPKDNNKSNDSKSKGNYRKLLQYGFIVILVIIGIFLLSWFVIFIVKRIKNNKPKKSIVSRIYR
jgi:hypothetical protein|uniref:Peptidase C1A papain C-terminal domain-containing protein n=1 Tax=viral metagenome TaxID=1070528 RepID=A0A6C0IZI3_9ZZZZ